MVARPLVAALLLACLWDHDTIRMEREAFPGVHEVLAGKFTRHSRAYYEWRIADRERRLSDSPDDPALLDDLAVAFDKTDRTTEAIALMRKSLAKAPGRYETLANLGTFLIHGGKLEEGLAFIRRAIAVNPDAHFGREIVQAHLVEYVQEVRRVRGSVLPLRPTRSEYEEEESDTGSDDPRWPQISRLGFAGFEPSDEAGPGNDEDLAKGLIGMMFFGRHESPILAECLGDVLDYQRHKRLACRAYLKASYHSPDERTKMRYRWLAERSMGGQTKGGLRGSLLYHTVELEQIEERFKDELAQGRALFNRIAADEAAWAKAGLDLDEEFARTYDAVGRTEDLSVAVEWGIVLDLAVVGTAVAGLVFLMVVNQRRKKRRRETRE
ncbi:MAG: tetratricopeptide repeat protein [Planctomycetota bacterium]